MDFARRDMLVERRFEVIGAGPRLGKRQDPEPTTIESTPAQTPTSSTPPETTSIPPTSTTPTASTTPIETTTSPTSPTSSDPVSTPVSTPTSTTPVSTPVTSGPSTPIETSQQSTPTSASPTSPTDPAQTSSAAPQTSPSATSEISTSAAGTANAPVVTTRVITSVLTNGAGSTVTVLSTSTSVGPTASPSNSGSSNNTGAIVGGVVGGVGGLLLLIALLWFIRRKTHKDKFEENMFAPDRNVDRREMDLAGDDVDDPEAIARPYHLPPSPTRNEMAMSAGSQPLSAQSHGRPLSELDEATSGMSRPTSGTSYYTQPGSGMGMPMPMSMTMPMPMPMSRDHIAYTHSRANSTHDHLTQPSEPATSEGGSSSARLMKDREARRLHVANDNEVIVHTDGGRVDEEPEEDAPREIPPTYESIGGPSGAR